VDDLEATWPRSEGAHPPRPAGHSRPSGWLPLGDRLLTRYPGHGSCPRSIRPIPFQRYHEQVRTRSSSDIAPDA